MPPIFDEKKCVKCKKCVTRCPGYVLSLGEKKPEVRYPLECWHCGCCRIACEHDAITFEFPLYTRL